MNQSVDSRPVAEGVMHGPYPGLSQDTKDLYERRYAKGMNNEISIEQFMADRESEGQYNQHADAVMDALTEERINPKQAEYLIDIVLRPLWIGYRHAAE